MQVDREIAYCDRDTVYVLLYLYFRRTLHVCATWYSSHLKHQQCTQTVLDKETFVPLELFAGDVRNSKMISRLSSMAML